MLFTRTLGLTFAIASLFLTYPKGSNAASVPLFDNMESMDTSEELLALTTTFKEFNWKGDSTYAGQTFIVSLDEPAQFQVTDYKNRGDHFDIYDNRLWIGRTSTVELLRDIHGVAKTPRHAIGDSHFSQGVFGLGKGTHIITIKATSPYGEGSGAIRLITGIESEDDVNVEGDYLPPPIEQSSSESNSTQTNATTIENDSSHSKNSTAPINDSDNNSQNQAQDEDEHSDREENDTKNDSENTDEDNKTNNEDQIKDVGLDHESNNSTSTNPESEDVPVSTNLTSTANSSVPTVTRSSTVTSTVVVTVYADVPSASSSLALQTSEPVITSASQVAPSETSEPAVASVSEASISQASTPASTSSTASEEE